MGILGVRAVVFGALLVVTVVSGLVLTGLGRPLNTALSTAHKLTAVAATVLAVLAVVAMNKAGGIGPVELALAIAAGVGLLALLASGAFLMQERPVSTALKAVHAAAPFLTAVAAGILLYLRLR
jgi:hypothetical protein